MTPIDAPRAQALREFERSPQDTTEDGPAGVDGSQSDTRSRSRAKRQLVGVMGALSVLLIMASWFVLPRQVAQDPPDRLEYPATPIGTNGLTVEERQQSYHLTEGGELYPIAWLLALEQRVPTDERQPLPDARVDGALHVRHTPVRQLEHWT